MSQSLAVYCFADGRPPMITRTDFGPQHLAAFSGPMMLFRFTQGHLALEYHEFDLINTSGWALVYQERK